MIDSKAIDDLARLARLSIPEEEKETLVKDINNMVEFIDVVQKVSLPSQGKMKFEQKNVARRDEVAPLGSVYDLVEAAPLHKDGFVQVPKVIGE